MWRAYWRTFLVGAVPSANDFWDGRKVKFIASPKERMWEKCFLITFNWNHTSTKNGDLLFCLKQKLVPGPSSDADTGVQYCFQFCFASLTFEKPLTPEFQKVFHWLRSFISKRIINRIFRKCPSNSVSEFPLISKEVLQKKRPSDYLPPENTIENVVFTSFWFYYWPESGIKKVRTLN